MTWDFRSADFAFDIAAKKIPELTFAHKLGENRDVDGAGETLWAPGGTWIPMTQAQPLSFVSDDADDDVGGVGARRLSVQGLDQDFDPIEEVIDLAGLAPVQTTLSYRRLNSVKVIAAGTVSPPSSNVGSVTATATVDGTPQGLLFPGAGSLLSSVFTVPRANRAWLLGAAASIRRVNATGGAQATFRLRIAAGIETLEPFSRTRDVFALALDGVSAMERTYQIPRDVEGPLDVWFEVENVSDNTTLCYSEMTIAYGPGFEDRNDRRR